MRYALKLVDEFRAKLLAGMRGCRASGLIARANFSCCGSCGHYELSEALAGKPKKTGYAFWHHQSEEGIPEGEVCIYFGNGTNDDAEVAKVGAIVAREMRIAGIFVRWDGTANHAVECWIGEQAFDEERKRIAKLKKEMAAAK